MNNIEIQNPDGTGKGDEGNPLDNASPWAMWVRVAALRGVADAFATYSNLNALRPSRSIWLDSTLGATRQKQAIKIDVYYPSQQQSRKDKTPAIINFHGGGMTVGRGTDDAIWANHLTANLGATVFSVNYRLAPEYSFPTHVEDCADAIVQIREQADEFGVDPNRLVISGFSAGGGMALASWALLKDHAKWGYKIPRSASQIAGLALFYPSLDQTVPKARKREGLPRQDLLLPKGLTDIFDSCYLKPVPVLERGDIRLSPALMPDDLVDQLPPVYLCLCEHDMLAAEGLEFSRRLGDRSIEVNVRVVPSARHGWDKAPRPAETVAEAYNEAVKLMQKWLQ